MPTPYARQIVELAQRWGIAESQLLGGTGISTAVVQKREARIPLHQFGMLAMNLQRLSERPGIGFDLGLHLTLTSHGKVGVAAMSASSLRDATEIAVKYIRKVWGVFRLELVEKDEIVELRLVETIPLGAFRALAYEVTLTVLWRHACLITGQARDEVHLDMPWPEPSYFAKYADKLPKIRWNEPHPVIRFPAEFLNYPLEMADPPASRHALGEAEQELAAISEAPESFLYKVRAQLKPDDNGFPSLLQVAYRLHTSERSLKRKLKIAGSSFRAQLQKAMHAEAERLMLNPDLTLQDISMRLGYEDPATFTHAFKRWTGQTPSQYRKDLNKFQD